jgi:hypothetical protein
LSAGGFVCVVAELVAQSAIDRRPMLILPRDANGAELRSRAIGGRKEPRRVLTSPHPSATSPSASRHAGMNVM